MGSISNNIQAFAKPLKEVLYEKKYQVDYFQREYKWQRKHIEQLIVDLEASFMTNYEEDHQREDVANYNSYYLGPIVISEKGAIRSIVDGQQRLTSLTLLLIYLNNIQSDNDVDLVPFIKSKKYGKLSYNIEVPDRTAVLDSIFEDSNFYVSEIEDESIQNMVDRYQDIENLFPEILKNNKLLMFIDWVKEKIVFVEIIAYSDENAYTIFETMNDRGLNLTPTEMLKGFLLTNVKNEEKIIELNDIWKETISRMHSVSNNEDLEFMRAWLRGHYAETIRSRRKDSGNEDFEKLGTKFHTWIKDNAKKIGLKNSDAFYYFIKSDFKFYSRVYFKIIDGIQNKNKNLEHLYLSSNWSIATSLSYPLLMAPIEILDDENTIDEKLSIVSKFLDIYSTLRTFDNKLITQSAIRYSIYLLVRKIRNKDISELTEILIDELTEYDEVLLRISKFDANKASQKFLRYVFARLIYYTEKQLNGKEIIFHDLSSTRKKNRYNLAQLVLSGNLDKYLNQFESESEYNSTVNQIGNLVYVPNPIKSVLDSISSEDKLLHLQNQCALTDSIVNSKHGLVDFFTLNTIDNFVSEEISERTNNLVEVINAVWNKEELRNTLSNNM